MATITVPQEYGWVLGTVALTMLSSSWHGFRIGPFRKRAGLTYPCPYADSNLTSAKGLSEEKALALHRFNCAQRAHGNFLENYGTAVTGMLVAGVRYPVAATVCGLGWNLGRVLYATGYTSSPLGSGKGRLRGSFSLLFQLGLVILTGMTGASLAGYL